MNKDDKVKLKAIREHLKQANQAANNYPVLTLSAFTNLEKTITELTNLVESML
jgi:hypothetical protein